MENNPEPTSEMSYDEVVERDLEKMRKLHVPINQEKFRKYLYEVQSVGNLFDFALKARCYSIRESLKRDYDHCVVIHSKEGQGKSTLSMQIAGYIDQEWNVSRLCFTLTDILAAFREAKPGNVVIIDEGAINFFSREAMTRGNRLLAKLFMISRQKNVCVIINIPNFHLLDSYIRDHRTDTLLAIKKRGRYTAFTGKAIGIISRIGHQQKQVFGIRVPNGTFWDGQNRKMLPATVDLQAYLKKKAEHLQTFMDDMNEETKVEKAADDYVLIRQASDAIGLTPKQFHHRIEKGTIPAKKILGRWYITKKLYHELINLKKAPENGAVPLLRKKEEAP